MLVAALAACAPTPPAAPSPGGTDGAAPNPSASDDPSTWTVGFDGVGPLALGDEIDDARTMFEPLKAEEPDPACPGVVFLSHDGYEIWLVLDTPDYRVVEEIVVTGGGPSTAEGIGVGSTLAEARAAYPGATESLAEGGSPVLSAPGDGGGWLNFSADSDEIVQSVNVGPYEGGGINYCE